MKRYKQTWCKGIIEDNEGDWVKYEEVGSILAKWRQVFNKYDNERIKCLFLTAGLLISIFCNF